MGHFINGGAKTTTDPASIEMHNKFSHLKSNCIFYNLKHNLHVAIVANIYILKGEELFIFYNVGYWQTYHKHHQTKFVEPISCRGLVRTMMNYYLHIYY